MSLVKFDRRIIARNLDKGLVSAKEYDKYLNSLPDLDGEYEIIDVPLYDTEEDEASDNPVEDSTPEGNTDEENQSEGV